LYGSREERAEEEKTQGSRGGDTHTHTRRDIGTDLEADTATKTDSDVWRELAMRLPGCCLSCLAGCGGDSGQTRAEGGSGQLVLGGGC